ncbi:hypothetical protein V496_00451 [Pseudogymnoascus sp. VKM F-4515 (FW-2607)]|nr:hypothetical protein V496_00451 [Pseudogymnoascus sp. VKM F-4515 (FW-2607)]KFY94640.1 hypothetical protein V498_03822 [Pseudogymnoascus sp. VKM F-4517 (FW-2822)]
MSRLEHSTVASDLFRPRLNSFTSQAALSRPATSRRNSTNAPRNPFETPTPSLHSRVALSTGSSPIAARPRRRFQSSRLVGEFEKPWLNSSKRGPNWDSIIFYTCVSIALSLGAYICYDAVRHVPKNEYCLVLEDTFSSLDSNTWSHEIQMNGFGTGSFDWTTDDQANSFVTSEGLHIVPTMTIGSSGISAEQLTNGYTVNLTADGTCTNSRNQRVSELITDSPCVAVSNSSINQIINPVRSARLTTAGKKTIKYGRVEVVARMPKGDWLWPAIWYYHNPSARASCTYSLRMMPQDSVYGEWPRSGEIDIVESRGNDAQTYPLGNNIVSSALHWGTTASNNMFQLSKGEWGSKRTKYSNGFHTFGLEWSEKYLFTWLDGRLRQVLFFNFANNKNLWTYGEFAGTTVNGSAPDDPWAAAGTANAPFDQSFYLILNVAVGSTNGWFPDGIGSKPWTDGSDNAMRDFWKANSTWSQTWGDGVERGMTVKSVKMWQEGKC